MDEIERKKEAAKKRRNEYEKERRKNWDFKLELNKKRWEKEIGGPNPDHRFLGVPPYNCFFWNKECKSLPEEEFPVELREKFGGVLIPLLQSSMRRYQTLRGQDIDSNSPAEFYKCWKAVQIKFHPDKM